MRDRQLHSCGSFDSDEVRSGGWPDRRGRQRRLGRVRVVALVLVLLVIGLAVGCANWSFESFKWPWQREKPRGLFPAEEEETMGLRLLWALPPQLKSPAKDVYLLPRTLYLVSRDNTFLALDPQKGYTHWEQIFDDEVERRAAEDDSNVYVIMANRLLTIDRETGGVLGDRPLGFVARSAPVLDGAYLYVGSADGRLYALDLGPRLGWQQTVGATVSARPQVDTAGAYFGSENGSVYSVSLVDGTREWQFATDGPIVADLALRRNVLYVGSTDHKLYALDTALGASRKQQQRWPLPYHAGGAIRRTPVVRGGTVYVVAENAGVHAVRIRDGEGLWQCDQADAFIAAGKDRVLLGAEGRRLMCVDRQTGEGLWEQELPGKRTYLFVDNEQNDLIYICRRRDGHLYCYQFED